MNPQDKTHRCPACGGEARLLVDVETETVPELDRAGNKQYYCTNCQKLLSVDAGGGVVQPPDARP